MENRTDSSTPTNDHLHNFLAGGNYDHYLTQYTGDFINLFMSGSGKVNV
jgi:hypothetical protein